MCDFVALRIRPIVNSEKVAVQKVGTHQVLVNNAHTFCFDVVFDGRDTQEQVYNLSVCNMLDKLFSGFNATILAYGQTGSGKTHTMGTDFDGSLDENIGVIPRAICDIFERIEILSGESEFVVKCSFMELYQDQLFDLLSEKSRDESIVDVSEDRNGLTEREVRNAQQTTEYLVKGSAGRAVASTNMNEASSRSHCIFTVTLQATKKDDSRAVTTSKFHLVDLAGSERSKNTGATGDLLKEVNKNNLDLSALGNVMSALGDGKGAGFVRYRDSKLTRLLQDPLGGSSVTLMIACVSSAESNFAETLNTLRYADRARKNKTIINQDPHAAEINRLKGIIQKLREELLTKGDTMTASLTNDLQGDENKELQEKYDNLKKRFQHDLIEHEMRAHIAEAAHERLQKTAAEMKSYVSELTKIQENHDEDPKLQETIMHISILFGGLDDELSKAQTEIMDHKQRSLCSTTNDGDNQENDDSSEMHEIIQERTDAFTSKQMEINDQLNLKEQLQQRMAGNFSKFSTLDDDIEDKYKECEQKIQELEAEKSELDKLRNVKENASALHNKQRIVLKRKCEEVMSINKRLKDGLEKQKEVIACVERELEAIISLINAELTLKHIMDDRGIINSRLGELKNQYPSPDPQSKAGLEIAKLQEEFDMRNAKISDLQQRLYGNGIDVLIRSLSDNVNSLIRSLCNNVNSLPVLKHLLKTLADMKSKHSQVVEELRSQLHTGEEKSNHTASRNDSDFSDQGLPTSGLVRNFSSNPLQQQPTTRK